MRNIAKSTFWVKNWRELGPQEANRTMVTQHYLLPRSGVLSLDRSIRMEECGKAHSFYYVEEESRREGTPPLERRKVISRRDYETLLTQRHTKLRPIEEVRRDFWIGNEALCLRVFGGRQAGLVLFHALPTRITEIPDGWGWELQNVTSDPRYDNRRLAEMSK